MIIYEVNKEKGTVVARFEGGRKYWGDSLYNMVDNILRSTCYYYPSNFIWDILGDSIELVGVAKLHPDDYWDEDFGKEIAKQRLNDKFNHVKLRVLKKLMEMIDNEYDEVTKRILKKI